MIPAASAEPCVPTKRRAPRSSHLNLSSRLAPLPTSIIIAMEAPRSDGCIGTLSNFMAPEPPYHIRTAHAMANREGRSASFELLIQLFRNRGRS
jgi:hypothetical protein